MQPARTRPRTASDRQHRLSQRRHVRLDHEPRRVRRPVRPRCAGDRRVLARLRGDAGAERGLQRPITNRTGPGRTMSAVHRPALLSALVFACVLLIGVGPVVPAAGAKNYPGGFRLQSSSLTVNEDAGHAVITIERSNARQAAQIRYITLGDGVKCGSAECTAVDPDDFHSVKGELDFPAGVASMSFDVRIVDHGTADVSKTLSISLFGPSPIGMASPRKAVLTILNNDPITPRDPQNPLALATVPGAANPLLGATFFVDRHSEVANAARRNPPLTTISSAAGHRSLRLVQLRPQRRPEHRDRGLALLDARIGRGARHGAVDRDLPGRARIGVGTRPIRGRTSRAIRASSTASRRASAPTARCCSSRSTRSSRCRA